MKRTSIFGLLGLCLFILTGCPVGLDYPLGNEGQEKNDTKLYGTWEINDPEETVLQFTASKKSDNSMRFVVDDYSEMFTPNTTVFTGWIVSLGGMRFLCLTEDADPSAYYHYVIQELSDTELKICDLSLLQDGIDAVTSQEALRKEVMQSMKKPEFLSTVMTYSKVKR